MKTFCYLCNRETEYHCDYCNKSTCLGHLRWFPNFEDFSSVINFIKTNFIKIPNKPSYIDYVISDAPEIPSFSKFGDHTYRNIYEKVFNKTTRPIELKADFCTNCALPKIYDYFNNILFPAIQKAKQSNDICYISEWCLFDTIAQCNHCGKYSCAAHLRACAKCGKPYCSENWWRGTYRDSVWVWHNLPDKGSCASKHKHLFRSPYDWLVFTR